tara:strand:- start:1208 stop:2500 length:1293 start_codon:yes stop_codon:yes gene_type:complete
MASAYSSVASVETGTSVRNRRRSFYRTQVTTLATGGVIRETYRTDAQGNNDVKISEVTTDIDGNITNKTTLSTASTEERRALQNSNSQLSNSIRQQTNEAGKKAQANSIDPGGALERSGGGSGNTAIVQETGDSQTTTTSAPSSTRNFGPMQYPETIAEGQDVIQFTALTYSVKTLTGFTFGGRERVGPGGGGGGRSRGTVTLPIQSGIKDQNAAGWGEDVMTPVDIAKAGVALNSITGGMGGFSDSINQLKGQLQGSQEDFKTLVASSFAEKAANVKGLLARTQGVIQNPNLELLFQKPTLRPFSFQFKLSARSKEEAEMIVKIIRFFKQNMAPQKGGGSGGTSANLFLKAPNTFQIHYMHKGTEEHPFIGRPKECAMTSFEVDYTPDGNYSTLKDGFMTSYTISMSLKELEPVFYEDYDDTPADSIGF